MTNKKRFNLLCIFIVSTFIPVGYHYLEKERVFCFDNFFSFYFVLPYLFSIGIYRDFFGSGLRILNIKLGMKIMVCFFILYLPLFFIFANNEPVRQYYGRLSMQDFVNSQRRNFLELFPTEYFFRGFMLFILAKNYAETDAILMQGTIYTILHIGKPFIECIGSFPVGLALGYLAIRTGSIWYGVLLHYLYGGLLLDIWRLRLS